MGLALYHAASVAAEVIRENVQAGPRSGTWWYQFGAERQSSAPGEFPQEQSGALYNSVGVIPEGGGEPAAYLVGSVIDPPADGHDYRLEFDPEDQGGRPWLARTMEDPDTHRAMEAGLADLAGWDGGGGGL